MWEKLTLENIKLSEEFSKIIDSATSYALSKELPINFNFRKAISNCHKKNICISPWEHIFIDADGNLSVCCALTDTFGNLNWLICGGETHHEKYMGRKMEPAWAQSIRNQSLKKRISFFFKQWGNWIPEGDKHDWYGKTSATFGEKGELLDGMEWKQFPNPKVNRNQLATSH